MRRALIHALFGTVAICSAAWAAYGFVRLQQTERVEQAILAASAPNAAARDAHGGGEAREVQLARAIALSKAGAYDAAARLYNGLIPEGGPPDEVGRAALFDLGNLYLREGAGATAQAVQSLAMIGEAKARYRLALRAAPDDWDARYNLERALWLAPETQSVLAGPDVKEQHNVKLRDPLSQDLP
ncbi:tetratricopeptide repeat protein [Paraburkholderia sp. MMS20-SJTN17]|uniref:Tetratricopeptide repeat protein n=1 Tax=Paraburkholderia translucens TaxID=2886945 RepID=A0ABS8KEC4_9BURK|nr:tetratricopeptide repeat protein [Paraburkholderia sp. MMS20-SJTN17]MCC8403117.1 tetratricopeptide repeat protein [Paraburkholderia sp. MMS20-SJTN17]